METQNVHDTAAALKECGENIDLLITHEQRCAALANDKFHQLASGTEYYKHRTKLAAFILQRDVVAEEATGDAYEVVALGTGISCYQGWQEYLGLLVHDCHALVVARRALLRYLYKEVSLYYSQLPGARDKCIFQSSEQTQSLVLKPNIFLHLYLSCMPEGATQSGLSWLQRTTLHLSIHAKGSTLPVSECPPSTLAARVCCMTATDKLLKWSILGVQGALLNQLMEPLYITSIITGATDQQMEALKQAVITRVQPPLDLALFPSFAVHGPFLYIGPEVNTKQPPPVHPTHSVNWSKGDKNMEIIDASTGQAVESNFSLPPSPGSRLCKAAMLMYYIRVQQTLAKHPIQDSYYQAKASSDQYQRVKGLLFSQLNAYGHGMWPRKLCVDRFKASASQGPDGDSCVRFQWDLH